MNNANIVILVALRNPDRARELGAALQARGYLPQVLTDATRLYQDVALPHHVFILEHNFVSIDMADLVKGLVRAGHTRPIIAVMPPHSEAMAASALRSGAYGFVTEPIDMIQLETQIHKAVLDANSRPASFSPAWEGAYVGDRLMTSTQVRPGSPGEALKNFHGVSFDDKLYNFEMYEVAIMKHALDITGGNISIAAETLGLARTTLYRKARRLGIEIHRRGARRGRKPKNPPPETPATTP